MEEISVARFNDRVYFAQRTSGKTRLGTKPLNAPLRAVAIPSLCPGWGASSSHASVRPKAEAEMTLKETT